MGGWWWLEGHLTGSLMGQGRGVQGPLWGQEVSREPDPGRPGSLGQRTSPWSKAGSGTVTQGLGVTGLALQQGPRAAGAAGLGAGEQGWDASGLEAG